MAIKNAFIVDGHPVTRAGLCSILENISGVRVAGEAGSGKIARQRLKFRACEIIFADFFLPDGSGLDLLEEIKKSKPDIQFVFLTDSRDWDLLEKAILLGARGYLLKDQDVNILTEDLKKILQGEKVFPAGFGGASVSVGAPAFRETIPYERLTPREKEILTFVSRGLASRDIARELNLSVRTVESHRSNILDKLQLKNAADFMRVAVGLNF